MSLSSRSKNPRTKKWEIIELPLIEELELFSEDALASMSLPVGFCIRFFRHDMHYLYTVASNYVRLTRGVLDYLQDYNHLGPNKSRNKLFVCIQYDQHRKCPNGSLCREIHCTIPLEKVEDASLYNVPSNATGAPSFVKVVPRKEIEEKKLNKAYVNNQTASNCDAVLRLKTVTDDAETTPLDTLTASGSLVDANGGTDSIIYLPADIILRHSLHSRWTSKKMYKTFQSGVLFKVALPNTPTPVDVYDSSELFITKGTMEFYRLCLGNESTTLTMQHCAHYSKNGICCFGEDCQFVHVLHYNPRERNSNADASNSDADIATPSYSEKKFSKSKNLNNPKGGVALTANQIKRFQNNETMSNSHASSSTQSTTSHSRALRPAPPLPPQFSNNLVFVPPSMMWFHLDPSSAPSMYGNPVVPCMVPQTMSSRPPVANNTYTVAQGANGETYLVQHVPLEKAVSSTSAVQNQQPVFMSPMPYP